MDENSPLPAKKLSIRKGILIFVSTVIVVGGGLLSWKAPTIVKDMAKSSLQKNLAPLGINEIDIEQVQFGFGRIYLREIHSPKIASKPHISIQEIDLALSIFFNIKAVDVVGATLELEQGETISSAKVNLQENLAQFWKMLSHLKTVNLPTIAMHDCLLVIPTSQGSLKLPIHATTETTVARNKVFTIDWGENAKTQFSGQFVLDSSRKGTTVDIHTTNIDFKTPSFQIKAPEISLWGTTGCKDDEGYKLDGFAKLDQLVLADFGSLKQPLEVNLEGEGTLENFDLDELTISGTGSEKSYIQLSGSLNPGQSAGKVSLTTQIAQLSNIWDFGPIISSTPQGKGSLKGKLNLTGEIEWVGDTLKNSVLALEIKGGSLNRDGFSIEGVNTEFLFNKLHPLTTKGVQRLTAQKLSLANVHAQHIDFQCFFDDKGWFQIKQISADVLGGKLLAHRFQREIKATSPSFQFETDFKNVELGELLKLTDLDSLKGKARLAGNASLNYRVSEGLDVLQAELHSISDTGVIQYKPASKNENTQSDNAHVNMANQVLDNFNFTVFNVRLEHVPDKPAELQGVIKMLGSNPNFLNGYPFEFNIVTTGPLKDLAMSFLNLMKPPSDNNVSQIVKQAKSVKSTKKAKKRKEAVPEEKPLEPMRTANDAVVGEENKAKVVYETPAPSDPIRRVTTNKTIKKVKKSRAKRNLKAKKRVRNINAKQLIKKEDRKLSHG